MFIVAYLHDMPFTQGRYVVPDSGILVGSVFVLEIAQIRVQFLRRVGYLSSINLNSQIQNPSKKGASY